MGLFVYLWQKCLTECGIFNEYPLGVLDILFIDRIMAKGCIKPEYKPRLIHRLKIVQGQVKGLEKAVEKEEYCVEVLNQSSAVQESLKSFDSLMLENHLHVHIAKNSDSKNMSKIINELLRIYRLNKK